MARSGRGTLDVLSAIFLKKLWGNHDRNQSTKVGVLRKYSDRTLPEWDSRTWPLRQAALSAMYGLAGLC